MNPIDTQWLARKGWLGLFVVGTAATLITTLANSLWLTYSTHAGRVVETGFLQYLYVLFLIDVKPQSLLPGFVNEFHELRSVGEVANFWATSAFANFLPSVIVGTGLLAIIRSASKMTGIETLREPTRAGAILGALLIMPAVLPVLAAPLNSLADVSEFVRILIAQALALFILVALECAFIFWILRSQHALKFGRILVRACVITGVLLVPFLAFATLSTIRDSSRHSSRLRPPRAAPNIFLVSIDSLRSDHLSSYGYFRETSPHIDRLAEDGVRFETVVSPTSWTLPSHISLLTGLDPLYHGVTTGDKRLAPGVPTLAQAFTDAGYTTAGIVSAPFLNAVYGLSSGFEEYDDYSIGSRYFGANHRDITSPIALDRIRKWLDKWDSGGKARPFFLFLHLWDVHYDYDPPAPYDSLFDPDYKGNIPRERFESNDSIHAGISQQDVDHIIALYDGEVRYTDEHLGEMIAHMESLGILEDTLVVVTADHGDEFFEHGEKGHMKTLYDEVVRVPLIMRFPRALPAGKVVDTPVRLIDVGPTILSIANIPAASFGSAAEALYAAQDLMPIVAGGPNAPVTTRVAFSDLLNGKVRAIRTAESKFIVHQGPHPTEFYDLKSDPKETHNLASGPDTQIKPLKELLSAWEAAPSDTASVETRTLSPEQADTLRSLGYIK